MGSSNLIRVAVLLVAALVLVAVIKAVIGKIIFLAIAAGAGYLLVKSLTNSKKDS